MSLTTMANNDSVCIENYENSATMTTGNNVRPTIIDFASVMQNSQSCVLPYSKIMKNVTIIVFILI